MSTHTDGSDELEYATSVEGNIAILREIAKIRFRERLAIVMPLVAKSLVAAGVDFSKVNFDNLQPVTDAEIDAIYEDFF